MLVLLIHESPKSRAAAALFKPTQILSYNSDEHFSADSTESRLIVLDVRVDSDFNRVGPEFFAKHLYNRKLPESVTDIDLLLSDIPREHNLLGFGDRFCNQYSEINAGNTPSLRVISHPRFDQTRLIVPEKAEEAWEIKGADNGGPGVFSRLVSLWKGLPTDPSLDAWLSEAPRARNGSRLILSAGAAGSTSGAQLKL